MVGVVVDDEGSRSRRPKGRYPHTNSSRAVLLIIASNVLLEDDEDEVEGVADGTVTPFLERPTSYIRIPLCIRLVAALVTTTAEEEDDDGDAERVLLPPPRE